MLKNKNFNLSKKYIKEVIELLDFSYPNAQCALEYKSPFQLLVATILSAQCTDVRVNKVTVNLFEKYSTVEEMSEADLEILENLIHSCGFFRNKALNILKTSKILLLNYNGQVPANLKDLVRLPGVGRKTANVVLGNAFGIPGLTVDTHLGRVSQRLGLSKNKAAEKIEQDLAKIIPENRWTQFSHQVISHGRILCKSRNPLCSECFFISCPAR